MFLPKSDRSSITNGMRHPPVNTDSEVHHVTRGRNAEKGYEADELITFGGHQFRMINSSFCSVVANGGYIGGMDWELR